MKTTFIVNGFTVVHLQQDLGPRWGPGDPLDQVDPEDRHENITTVGHGHLHETCFNVTRMFANTHSPVHPCLPCFLSDHALQPRPETHAEGH